MYTSSTGTCLLLTTYYVHLLDGNPEPVGAAQRVQARRGGAGVEREEALRMEEGCGCVGGGGGGERVAVCVQRVYAEGCAVCRGGVQRGSADGVCVGGG